MNPVHIDLTTAAGARLALNSLFDSPDPIYLDQDLVLVELPGDRFIDVSWLPAGDTSGTYHVTVFRRNDWDNPIRLGEANTASSAARLVEYLAEEYARSFQPVANTGGVKRTYEAPWTPAA